VWLREHGDATEEPRGQLYLGYSYLREGSLTLAVFCGSYGVCFLLLWFDLKEVAVPLILLLAVPLAGGVIKLFTDGFSWWLFARIFLVFYTICEVWEWRTKDEG